MDLPISPSHAKYALVFSLFLCLSLAPPQTYANPGDLDPTFGAGGIQLTSVGARIDQDDFGHSVVPLSGGGYAVGGYVDNGDNFDFAIARYTSTGELDTTFGGGDGVVTTSIGAGDDQAYSLIEDSAGNLILGGHTENEGDVDFALVRYTSAGDLDSSFGGGDGIVITKVGTGADYGRSVIEDINGNLLLAGDSYNGTDTYNDFALVRYSSSGELDTLFGGGDGIVLTETGISKRDSGYVVIEDESGRFVVAGVSGDLTKDSVGLVRYTSQGALDLSFGDGDGIVIAPLNPGDTYDHKVYALIEDSAGRLVVAGSTDRNGIYDDFYVARFDASGALDASFGSGAGWVTTSVGANGDQANSLIEDANGNLIVAGTAIGSGAIDFGIVRYDESGALDATFGGGDGVLKLAVSGSHDFAHSLVVDNEGFLVLAGYSHNGTDYDFSLVRLDSAGDLDTTFGGGDGIVNTAIEGSEDYANHVVEDGNGNLVVAGRSFNGSDYDFSLAKYDSSGFLDSSFGDGGVVISPLGPGNDEAYAMIRDASGNFVVAGLSHTGSTNDFALVRYTASGALDTSFGGGDGIVVFPIGSGDDQAYSIIEDREGNLVVAGSANNGSNWDFALARFTSAGVPDASFGGGDGIVATDLLGASSETAYSVIEDSSGNLVVAGGVYNGFDTDFAVARYTSSGILDTSFGGGDGIVTTTGGGNDYAKSVIEDNAGNLVVAGYMNNGINDDFALARYTNSGDLDTSFGEGAGFVITPIGAGADSANSVIEDAAGNLVVTGSVRNGTKYNLGLVRYTASGALDSDFGDGDGITWLDNGIQKLGHSLIQDRLGRYVVAGWSYAPSQFLIARFDSEADSDLDGIPDSHDAFPNNNAAFLDSDGDGFPDAWNQGCDIVCQSSSGLTLDSFLNDRDNDGREDSLDAFPDDPNEWEDSDDDGVGNNSDAFPYDPTETADADGDGIGDNTDDNNAFDTNPPEVIAPPDLILNAGGETTDVDLGSAVATDFLDGSLIPTPDDAGPYNSGVHYITWSATDAAGNIGTDIQKLTIYPQVGFEVGAQTIGEGSLAIVKVLLSGPSPEYPIQIPVFLDGASTATMALDHNATDISLTITMLDDPANEAEFQFDALDDGLTGEADETVVFALDGISDMPYIGEPGSPTRYLTLADTAKTIVTLTELNLPPVVSISVKQHGEETSTVFAGAGAVDVAVTIDDPNPNDTHAIRWYVDGVFLPEYNDLTQGVIPSNLLTVGDHTVQLEVTDSGLPSELVIEQREISVKPQSKKSSGGGSFPGLMLIPLALGALARKRRLASPSGFGP